MAIEGILRWRRSRAERMMRLLHLASTLRASRAVFAKQNELARGLVDELLDQYESERPAVRGYDAILTHSYARLTPQQRETHRVIRGMTEHALRGVKSWMADPAHALVYMADEQDHGVPLPTDLDNAVDAMLANMGATVIARDHDQAEPLRIRVTRVMGNEIDAR